MTSKAPFPDAPETLDEQNEHAMKKQATEFLREQKRLIRRRQAAMHKAREEWQRNAEILDDVYPNTERAELVRVLTQVCPSHGSGIASDHQIPSSFQHLCVDCLCH